MVAKRNRKSVDLVVQYLATSGAVQSVPVRVNLAWCHAHGMTPETAALYHVRAKVLDWVSFDLPESLPNAA
jgi:hypothetical protein